MDAGNRMTVSLFSTRPGGKYSPTVLYKSVTEHAKSSIFTLLNTKLTKIPWEMQQEQLDYMEKPCHTQIKYHKKKDTDPKQPLNFRKIFSIKIFFRTHSFYIKFRKKKRLRSSSNCIFSYFFKKNIFFLYINNNTTLLSNKEQQNILHLVSVNLALEIGVLKFEDFSTE